MNFVSAILIILFFSCDSNSQTKGKLEKENIGFDFETAITGEKDFYIVTGKIFNKKTDTVYFLSSTCNGEANLIESNSNQSQLMNQVSCYINAPKITALPPKSYLLFGKIKMKNHGNKVKLGFNFYEVNKGFNLDKTSVNKNFKRVEANKTIIWAKEKRL